MLDDPDALGVPGAVAAALGGGGRRENRDGEGAMNERY